MIFPIAIFIGLLAIDSCDSSPIGPRPSFLFRRRRQTSTNNILSSDFFCALQCGVDHSSAWSRVSNMPSVQNFTLASVLPSATTGRNAVLNDTFNNLCLVYRSYASCLQSCPNSVLTNSMQQGTTSLSVLCDSNNKDYISQTPCLYKNNRMIMDTCKGPTDDLFAASKALQDLQQSNDVGFATNGLALIRELCSAANRQAQCVLPTAQQYCGDQASDFLQSILQASLNTLRQAAGTDFGQLSSPECTSFFHTVESGAVLNFISPNATNSTSIDPASNRSDSTLRNDSSTGSSNSNMVKNVLARDSPVYASRAIGKSFSWMIVVVGAVMSVLIS